MSRVSFLPVCFAFAAALDSTMVVTYEAVGVKSSQVSSATTFDFNDLPVSSQTDVPWTGWGGNAIFKKLTIVNANKYQGADATKSPLASDSNPVELTFSTPVSYFGLWWSAGDDGNILEFYNGEKLLWQFTAGVMSALGSEVWPDGYKGNPNSQYSGENSGQYYAFINFFVQEGTQITRVLARGSNFETDNWAVRDPAYGLVAGDSKTLPGSAIAGYTVDEAGSQTVNTDVSTISVEIPTRCPEPTYTQTNVVFDATQGWGKGATISVTCAQGWFSSTPLAQVRCKDNGAETAPSWEVISGTSWTTCVEIDCEEPAAAGFTFSSGSSTLGATRTATCAPGMSGQGSSVSCKADTSKAKGGTWDAPSGCTKVGCGPVTQIGYVFTGSAFTAGSAHTASCAEGFLGSSPTSVTCQNSGLWSAATGCEPVNCGAVPPIPGYTQSVSSNLYGEYAATCAQDYSAVGSPKWTCGKDGTWTSSGCVFDCGEKKNNLPDGYATPSGSYQTKLATVVSTTCTKGFVAVEDFPRITCTLTGWEGSGCSADSQEVNENSFSGATRTPLSLCTALAVSGLVALLA